MLGLLLAALLALTVRKVPASEGAELWAVAVLPLGVGAFLVSRGENLPAVLLVLREPLLLAGYGLLLIGLRQYLRLGRPWALTGGVVLVALVVAAVFVVVLPNPGARWTMRMGGIAVLMGAAAFTLRHLQGSLLREVRLFLQLAFSSIALLAVLRAALHLLPGLIEASQLRQANEFASVVTAMLVLGVIAGLMLLMTARMNESLAEVSVRDELTGLLNRRGIEEAATSALSFARRVGRPLALLLCDLDHFSRVNERHGHAGGDAVLRDFALLLEREFADQELVGRHGGEEFVIVLPGVDAAAAQQRADHLRRAVETHRFAAGEGAETAVTVSIGLTTQHPADGWQSLLARADSALYRAKESGRNRCIHQPAGTAAPVQGRTLLPEGGHP